MDLESIIQNFKNVGDLIEIKILNSGHINDTFLVLADGKFVLQKLNGTVFKNIPALMANKVAVSKYLKSKRKSDLTDRSVLTFIPAKNGLHYVKSDNEYWCMSYYIKDSVTIEKVNSEKIALEAGRVTGRFLADCSDFDALKLTEVLSNFHKITDRLIQLERSIGEADPVRIEKAQEILNAINLLKEEMTFIEDGINSREIPLRVTHNDTKISNILFDEKGKGLCMIDTDTVMPGAVAYDFGDAIRTICNAAAEDEKDLSKVEFKVDYFSAYSSGFLSVMKPKLTGSEIKSLIYGVRLMPFIMAVRFMTDYLIGDVYFKIKHPEHNLERAKNQMKLLECIDENRVVVKDVLYGK